MARIKADEVCVGDTIIRPGDALWVVVSVDFHVVDVHLHCVQRHGASETHETFAFRRLEMVSVAEG